VFGTARIVKLRPMAIAVVAPLMIGLTVQALGGSPADAASHQVEQAEDAARVTVAKRSGTATLRFAGAPVGQTASGRTGLTPGVATFSPARPGRTVLVQVQQGRTWKTVVRTEQDNAGQASFNVRAIGKDRQPLTYRALTAHNGFERGVTSATARATALPMLWKDEFTGSGKLDPTIWSHRQVGERVPPRRLCSEVSEKNARRKGGAAVLEVRKLPGKAPKRCRKDGQFSNAMVAANNPAYHMKYGIAAARIKFQSNRGQHSAFWLQVPDGQVSANPPSTGVEIDIAEYFGDDRRKGGLASYVHYLKGKKDISVGGEAAVYNKSKKLLKRGKEWSDAYHVYSVEWTPTKYIFRVDGHVTLTTSKSISDAPEMVVLSALSSDWETPAMNAKRFPTVTKYDWVRVWGNPAY
jgi:beta-glucanase (GH16 family)